MSQDSLVPKQGGDDFTVSVINRLKLVMGGDWFPRKLTGVITDGGGSIGSDDFRWAIGHIRKILLGGGAVAGSLDQWEFSNDSGSLLIKRGSTEILKITGNELTKTVDGSDPGLGGLASTDISGSYSTSSSSYSDVTNLSATLTTKGRPVFGILEPFDATEAKILLESSAVGTSDNFGFIKILRGGVTVVGEHKFGFAMTRGSSSTRKAIGYPPAIIKFLDKSIIGTPGTYTYKVQAKINSGETLSVLNCALTLKELI